MSAKIKIGKRFFVRPINTLYPMEVEDEGNNIKIKANENNLENSQNTKDENKEKISNYI